MDDLIHGIRWFVEALLRPLDGLVPWVSLALLAVPTAAIMLVVVRWTSPQRVVTRARSQMAAAIFEMRIYLDRPSQLLRAQGRLVVWSALYVAALLPSLLVMAGPLGLLYLHLEIRHGIAPAPAPSLAVARIEVAGAVALRDVAIDASGRVAVAARVHAEDEHALYARFAIAEPGTHHVVVRAGGTRTTATIEADPDADVVSPERRSGIAALWALGAEPPLDGAALRSISIRYPERTAGMPWWLSWLGPATVFALVLRRRFGVAL